MTPPTLPEAMRLGFTITRPIKGKLYNPNGDDRPEEACPLGSAIIAFWTSVPGSTRHQRTLALHEIYPCLTQRIHGHMVGTKIADRFDSGRMTREQVADWLETLDLDLSMPPEWAERLGYTEVEKREEATRVLH